MIVTCPECSTRYKIDKSAIGANGRTVCCTQCNASWFVTEALDMAALSAQTLKVKKPISPPPDTLGGSDLPSEPSMAERAKMASKAQSPVPPTLSAQTAPHIFLRDKADNQRRRRRLAAVAGIWAVPLLLIGSIVAVSYFSRQEIVAAMPNTATAYKALGIDVSLSGLTIEEPVTRSAYINGQSVLLINGAVKNISTAARDVPLIELSLHSPAGETLASWLVDTKLSRLKKGEQASFTSEYPGAPVDAVELRYKFADETAFVPQTGPAAQTEASTETQGAE